MPPPRSPVELSKENKSVDRRSPPAASGDTARPATPGKGVYRHRKPAHPSPAKDAATASPPHKRWRPAARPWQRLRSAPPAPTTARATQLSDATAASAAHDRGSAPPVA